MMKRVKKDVDEEPSFKLASNFFDSLLGLEEPEAPTEKQVQKSQIREQMLKDTDQKTTSTTTLQTKIDKKKVKAQKKIERNVQVIEEQLENIEEEDKVAYNLEKNEGVFAMDTEFQQLGLGKGLIKALNDMEFHHPTKVQKESIPVVISGKDVMVSSMTGSGKTGAFLLPALQRFGGTTRTNYSKVLVVLPTRELALQCYEMLEKFNKYVKCSATLVIGAVPIAKQEVELRKHPDIIIATPGRLVDLLKNSYSIDLQNIEMLILDEADRILEMGFEKEIDIILKETPPDRQTILFSATMTAGIHRLSSLALKKPVRIQVDYDESIASGLVQYLCRIRSNDPSDREAVLLALLTKQFTNKTIVFVKTKKDCHRLAIIMGLLDIRCTELHGNLSQQQRISAFEDFKDGKFDILLATDLAARGLDIHNVKAVINFEIPYEVTRYIHRVGRTARIGNEGVCATLCLESEVRDFKKMIRQSKLGLERLQVNQSRVQQFKDKIYQLEDDIFRILREEHEERELRKAEMEAQKAENMLTHDEEIFNRPKKTWIESFKQKIKRNNAKLPERKKKRR